MGQGRILPSPQPDKHPRSAALAKRWMERKGDLTLEEQEMALKVILDETYSAAYFAGRQSYKDELVAARRRQSAPS